MWVTRRATYTSCIPPRRTLAPAFSCVQTNRLAEALFDVAHTILLIASSPNLRRRPGWDVIALRSIRTRQPTWLQVKFAAINTLPRVGHQKRYSPQVLTCIHALEENSPSGRETDRLEAGDQLAGR